jgi:hypothetical protein
MMSRSRAAACLVAIASIVVGACEAWTVFVRQTPAIIIQGQHERPAYEFGEGARVSQTFQMIGTGLTAFDVKFAADRSATLLLECELAEEDAERPGRLIAVHRWFVTLKRVSGVEWSRITFPPIIQSNKRQYMFRFQLIGAAAAPHPEPEKPLRPRVAVIVSTDNVLGGGVLWVGDQRQAGSLSLRAFTQTRTAYRRFRADVAPGLPSWLQNPIVEIAILIAYQWALLAVMWVLMTGCDAVS